MPTRGAATVELTETEVGHLLTLLIDAEREGNYYGPKAQYWARNSRIMAKLMLADVKAKYDE